MALTLLATATASTSTTIDFTGFIDSAYLVYELHMIGVNVTTDNTNIGIRISTDGGSTWKSGASDYEYGSVHNTYRASAGANMIVVSSSAVGNAAGENYAAVVTMFCPSNTATRTQFIVGSTGLDPSATPYAEIIGGSYKATTAVNGLQVLIVTGSTIDTGEFKLYGVAAS